MIALDPTTHYGPFTLAAPLMQAGLAGYSDRAMRVVARRRGCPYAVTEALLDTILLSGGLGLRKSIDINDEDHPVAGQVMGAEASTMAAAAKILADAGYDVIDLNFACPVKKVRNKARGGSLLKEFTTAADILSAVREAVPPGVPTSVSMRKGWDDTPASRDVVLRLIERAASLGYVGVRVHARTVEQKYAGRATWSDLSFMKQAFPNLFLWGSGDVFRAEDAVEMLRRTGVDGVWVARGAIGNPWIFGQIVDLLHDRPVAPPTVFEQRSALEEHFAGAVEVHGEPLAGRRMRKLGMKYARFHPAAEQVRRRFIATSSLRDWTCVLNDFYADDAPGLWPATGAEDEVNDGAGGGCGCAAAP